MAMVRFRNAMFAERVTPFCLEESIRFTGALAGIHDWTFGNTIDEDGTSLANFVTDPASAWAIVGGHIVGTGGGAANTFYQARHLTQVKPGFILTFSVTSGSEGAFIWHGQDTASKDALCIFFHHHYYGVAHLDAAGQIDQYLWYADNTGPGAHTGAGRCSYAIWERLDSSDFSKKWTNVAIVGEGALSLPVVFQQNDLGWDHTQEYVGFAAFEDQTMEIWDIRVAELKRIVEYVSVDQGETAQQGMARAVDNTRVRFVGRYDGSVLARRPGNRTSVWTVPQERLGTISKRKDRATSTHVRVVGAVNMVDRFDDDEGEHHMHRFTYADDPNMLTDRDAYDEAGFQLNEAKELQDTGRTILAGQPLIEPQDVLTLDGTDKRLNVVQHEITMTEQGSKMSTTVEYQDYEALP